MIRKANVSDIDKIIDLHLDSFSDSHFSVLFSRKMLAKYFIKLLEDNIYSYVCYNESQSEVLGYVITGFKTKEAVASFTKENRIALLITLIKNPRFLIEKLIELFQKSFRIDYKGKAKCRLYLIAINNNYKGKGIGKELILFLERQLKKDHINTYGLSVRKDNKSAIDFYRSQSYEAEFENSKSIYYKKTIQ
jgi:ribosomal protein S18 acetylase RimI-like enzyme